MEDINITNGDVSYQDKKATAGRHRGSTKYTTIDSNISHQYMKNSELFNQAINNTTNISKVFTQGLTYLKPKSKDTNDPNKYRSITCLHNNNYIKSRQPPNQQQYNLGRTKRIKKK